MRSPFSPALQQGSQAQPALQVAPAATTISPPPPPPPQSPTRSCTLQPPQLPLWHGCRAAVVDTQAFLQGLGPLAPTARPSALQPLAQLGGGAHSPSSPCCSRLAADGTQLAEMPVDRAGQLLPVQNGVLQCHLELGVVKGVPPSGVKDRHVAYHIARACLYDGARFHGSTLSMRPRKVKPGRGGGITWHWDEGVPMLVRCPLELLQRGVALYLELNVAHELLPEEKKQLLAKHAVRQVTEVCVAYALVDLSTLPTLHAARSLSVPLRGGPLALRWTLQQCAAAESGHAAPPHGCKAAPPTRFAKASLTLQLKPVPPVDTAAALLPRLALASAPTARVVSLYRQLLAEALGTGAASLAPVADPVLAAFPAVLDDEDLSAAFMHLWRQELLRSTATGAPPATSADLRAAFRRCVIIVWAARNAQAVPPPKYANDSIGRGQRRIMLQQCTATPASSLGSSAHAWLHRPFDCRELRAGSLEALGATI